jgi:hypothetical protein
MVIPLGTRPSLPPGRGPPTLVRVSFPVFLAIDLAEGLALGPKLDEVAGGQSEIGGGDTQMNQVRDLPVREDDLNLLILLVLPVVAIGPAIRWPQAPFGEGQKEEGRG